LNQERFIRRKRDTDEVAVDVDTELRQEEQDATFARSRLKVLTSPNIVGILEMLKFLPEVAK
jgi:hypothetical protein